MFRELSKELKNLVKNLDERNELENFLKDRVGGARVTFSVNMGKHYNTDKDQLQATKIEKA